MQQHGQWKSRDSISKSLKERWCRSRLFLTNFCNLAWEKSHADSLTWPTFRSKKLAQPKHCGNPLRRLFLDVFQVSGFKSNISFAQKNHIIEIPNWMGLVVRNCTPSNSKPQGTSQRMLIELRIDYKHDSKIRPLLNTCSTLTEVARRKLALDSNTRG